MRFSRPLMTELNSSAVKDPVSASRISSAVITPPAKPDWMAQPSEPTG
jgi:hypothetical protein